MTGVGGRLICSFARAGPSPTEPLPTRTALAAAAVVSGTVVVSPETSHARNRSFFFAAYSPGEIGRPAKLPEISWSVPSQLFQTPSTGGWLLSSTSARAVTRVSGPACFCKSPSASIRARRALLRASAIAAPWPTVRSDTAERVNNPTAMIVSRTISRSVAIRAIPRSLLVGPATNQRDRSGREVSFAGLLSVGLRDGFIALKLLLLLVGHVSRGRLLPPV